MVPKNNAAGSWQTRRAPTNPRTPRQVRYTPQEGDAPLTQYRHGPLAVASAAGWPEDVSRGPAGVL